MNILYISHLSKNIAAGPVWSVPACVNAQSKIDNVFWINFTDVLMPHWQNVSAFHHYREFGSFNLSKLPASFNSPDLVVFEDFYYFDDVKLSWQLRKKKIPYIIVPRGALTKEALHNHAWLKKYIANILFFDSFVNHSLAVQFLTQGECDNSISRYSTNYLIVPNGFDIPFEYKRKFSKDKIKAVFIGRIDMYHKGLDLLCDAIHNQKEKLQEAGFTLDIYGPQRCDYYKLSNYIVKHNISDIIRVKGEVSGEEKRNVLLESDLFIMTSRLEGHPMGLIEALAYGVPAFVTRGTNMKDQIEETNAGWTCEGSVKDIEESLLLMIKERTVLPMKGEAARQLSYNYDWNKLAFTFHEKINNLLSNI